MQSLGAHKQVIRDAGYRLTRPREAVLRVLANAEGFLDAAAIYERGRRIHRQLGRVSVYRTLELLTELGLIRRVHGVDGCHSYARSNQVEGHYLICTSCGRVKEFPCEGVDNLAEAVGEEFGYTIEHHLLQLEGLCPKCRRAKGYLKNMSEAMDEIV